MLPLLAAPTLESSVDSYPYEPTRTSILLAYVYKYVRTYISEHSLWVFMFVWYVPIRNILRWMYAKPGFVRTYCGQAKKIIKMFVWDFSSLYLDYVHAKFCLHTHIHLPVASRTEYFNSKYCLLARIQIHLSNTPDF